MRLFNFTKKLKQEEQKMSKIDEILGSLDENERRELKERLKDGDDTTEQIKEAKTDIAEKGDDSQTPKDRIDESVAAQERNDKDRDSQSARDRVDEAEGEDKHLKYDSSEDIEERLRSVERRLDEAERYPREVKNDSEKSKLEEYHRRYFN